jgi:hypothetical protein
MIKSNILWGDYRANNVPNRLMVLLASSLELHHMPEILVVLSFGIFQTRILLPWHQLVGCSTRIKYVSLTPQLGLLSMSRMLSYCFMGKASDSVLHALFKVGWPVTV